MESVRKEQEEYTSFPIGRAISECRATHGWHGKVVQFVSSDRSSFLFIKKISLREYKYDYYSTADAGR